MSRYVCLCRHVGCECRTERTQAEEACKWCKLGFHYREPPPRNPRVMSYGQDENTPNGKALWMFGKP